jgi:hypothetical protein
VIELRAKARDDLGIRATCLLAALGNEHQRSDAELARAYAGATFLAESMQDLKQLATEFHKLMEALSRR